MSVSPGSVPPPSGLAPDPTAAFVAAMETAPAAMYCLAADTDEPVWANARGRALGTRRADLPHLDGRSIADLVDEVLGTGRPETISGQLSGGLAATATVRPLQLAGGSRAR
jgi:hypothetical protein